MKTRFIKTPTLAPRPIKSCSFASKRRKPSVCIATLLVCVDFSADSRKTVDFALALARQLHAALHLVHIIPPIVTPADFGYGAVMQQLTDQNKLRKARNKLNAFARRIAESSQIRACTTVLSGIPSVQIIQLARSYRPDLIIISAHRPTPELPKKIDSTAKDILIDAPCPVLLFRSKSRPRPAYAN